MRYINAPSTTIQTNAITLAPSSKVTILFGVFHCCSISTIAAPLTMRRPMNKNVPVTSSALRIRRLIAVVMAKTVVSHTTAMRGCFCTNNRVDGRVTEIAIIQHIINPYMMFAKLSISAPFRFTTPLYCPVLADTQNGYRHAAQRRRQPRCAVVMRKADGTRRLEKVAPRLTAASAASVARVVGRLSDVFTASWCGIYCFGRRTSAAQLSLPHWWLPTCSKPLPNREHTPTEQYAYAKNDTTL